jgi:hypothetical protein
MNYIKTLEKISDDRGARLIKYEDFLNGIVAHLETAKFKGEENGDRKDWIATADIIKMIYDFKRELYTNEGA